MLTLLDFWFGNRGGNFFLRSVLESFNFGLELRCASKRGCLLQLVDHIVVVKIFGAKQDILCGSLLSLVLIKFLSVEFLQFLVQLLILLGVLLMFTALLADRSVSRLLVFLKRHVETSGKHRYLNLVPK